MACASDRSATTFEENQGQWSAPVLYTTSAPGYRVFLRADGLQLSATAPNRAPQIVELHWLDSGPRAEVTAEGLVPYRANYFVGSNRDSWKTLVPYFSSVRFHNLYPRISVDYHHAGGELEQDIDVDSGADAAKVRFEVKGANEISMGKSGQLELRTRRRLFRSGGTVHLSDRTLGKADTRGRQLRAGRLRGISFQLVSMTARRG
jgi:hypothetical protein